MNKRGMQKLLHSLIPETSNKKVFVVNGAPGSGKTTFVQKEKKENDLVVDMDLLSAALKGSFEPHPDYNPVMDASLAAREGIFKTIERREGNWERAYVITSSPNPERVASLAKRLHADVVEMTASKDECVRRILEDASRKEKQRDVSLVEKWFSGK